MSKFRIFVRLYNTCNKFKFVNTIGVYKDNGYDVIELFGNPEAIYTKSWIVDDKEIKYAKKYYEEYRNVANDGSPLWEERWKKAGNRLYSKRDVMRMECQDRANCKHRYTKTILLNLTYQQKMIEIPIWDKVKERHKENGNNWFECLWNVSICEHLRWEASHLMMGYSKMESENRELLKELNKDSKKQFREKNKQHDCIVDWNELSSDIQKYDYIVVKTTIELFYKQNENETE